MHPKEPVAFSTRTVEDISILRTDMPLLVYQPDSDGDDWAAGQNFD